MTCIACGDTRRYTIPETEESVVCPVCGPAHPSIREVVDSEQLALDAWKLWLICGHTALDVADRATAPCYVCAVQE